MWSRNKKDGRFKCSILSETGIKDFSQSDNLWVKLVTAKYLQNDNKNFLHVKTSSSTSPT